MTGRTASILSVDIGTGATKAVLFDVDARQLALCRKTYAIPALKYGWSEQDPDLVVDAVFQAIRELLEKNAPVRLAGVAYSSQLHSVLAVSVDGKPLSKSIPWTDRQSAPVAERIRKLPSAGEIAARTGCPPSSLYPLAKIGWLKENIDLPSTARYVSIKDYVIYRLTGRWVTDWMVASGSGLLNIRRLCWEDLALKAVGISPENLPEVASPRLVLTVGNTELATRLNLPPETPLILGGGDGQLASMGVGALDQTALAVNVGTSAAARLVIPEPTLDPDGKLWTYVMDDVLWVTGGNTSSGGVVYDWFLKRMMPVLPGEGGGAGVEELRRMVERAAASVPPGAEDLFFLPYLSGEQCPGWRPQTRGGFVGLGLHHHVGHLGRAVLEGITRSVYRIAERIGSVHGGGMNEIRVTGGLVSSSLWLQIAADMFGVPITVPACTEGSARGAAMLGLVALGIKRDLSDFGPVEVKRRVHPRAEAHAYYRSSYPIFLEMVERMGSISD